MKRTISFKKKMGGSFLMILFVIVAMGAAGLFAIQKLNVQIGAAFTYFVPSTDFLIQADRDLQQLLVAERTLLGNEVDEETQKKEWAEIATNKKQFEERISKYEALAKTQKEKDVMTLFWQDHKKWEGTLARTQELLKEGSLESMREARKISLGEGATFFENMRERLNILQEYLGEYAAIETANSERLYEQSSAALMGGIGLSFLLVALIYFTLVNKVSGQLTKFVEELMQVVSSLGHETSTVGSSSKRLSSGVSNQASSVDQTVSALDEINAMVSRNSDTCEQSGVMGRECEAEAERGQGIVQNMIRTIEHIGEGNKKLFDDVEKGNKEMERIVGMIRAIEERTKVIHDIVFQTKLLSFNASVEAARAGVHGKGFSLVAEEVGKLAAVTGSAASEITGLIENSVEQVEEIVKESQRKLAQSLKVGDESLSRGRAAAQECEDALRSIVDRVTRSNQILEEVNRASQEQSVGIKEINEAIQNIDMITKENADLASSTELVVVELESQSKRLELVTNGLETIVHGKNAA